MIRQQTELPTKGSTELAAHASRSPGVAASAGAASRRLAQMRGTTDPRAAMPLSPPTGRLMRRVPHGGILPVFCPTGQRRPDAECLPGTARKTLVDQGGLLLCMGLFSDFGLECERKSAIAGADRLTFAHTMHA